MFPVWEAMETKKTMGGKLEKNEVISIVKQRTKSIIEALENYREL